jgi:ParB/RepB/Spo0J family partition protein
MTKKVSPSMTQADIDSLVPNPWNSNHISDPENERKLKESLTRYGFFKPVLVREREDGSLEILGGEHRWRAARELGYSQVPVANLGHVDDKTAKEIGLLDNGRYGEDNTIELAALLDELGTDIAGILPYSDAEVQSILKAAEIDLDDLDIDTAGEKLPNLNDLKAAPTTQLMRFKVPVEDIAWAAPLIDRVMKEGGFTSEDSLTNAGNALVVILKAYKDALQ